MIVIFDPPTNLTSSSSPVDASNLIAGLSLVAGEPVCTANKSYVVFVSVSVELIVSLFALSLVTVTLVPPAISISSFVFPDLVTPSNLIFVVPIGTNKS